MSKYRMGVLYVRRIKPSDTTDSMITAVQMAARRMLCERLGKRPPFVLVRHGRRGESVMAVDYSRRGLQSRIYGSGGRNFKATARAWRDRAQ